MIDSGLNPGYTICSNWLIPNSFEARDEESDEETEEETLSEEDQRAREYLIRFGYDKMLKRGNNGPLAQQAGPTNPKKKAIFFEALQKLKQYKSLTEGTFLSVKSFYCDTKTWK